MSTTQTYKCISSYATIKSKPSLFASNLGTLRKGNLIEVISINGSWAYFKYNNKNAYILTMYVQKVETVVTGSITIRYLNIDTNAEIASSVTNNNLTLKSYTYSAPSIANYTVVNPSSKSITLTVSNPNQEVIFYYKENKVYGSITIKYVDKATNATIAESKVYKDLELGTYSYDAINILGYTIFGYSTKSVTLTKEIYDVTITFEYNKIFGQVSIQYIDTDTKKEIAPAESYSNLELKDYSYSAKDIDGYTLSGDSTKSVTLTDNNPNQTIIFEYKLNEVVPPTEPVNPDEIPYISTYEFSPRVNLNEDIIIPIYMDDYMQTGYLEDKNIYFDIYFTVEGIKGNVKNILCGDYILNLGKCTKEGENTITIQIEDKQGRKSQLLYKYILGINPTTYPITTSQTYTITDEDLDKYSIKKNNSEEINDVINTRDGMTALLNKIKVNGYRKAILPQGIYRIAPSADRKNPIYIPSNFTLDLNGSTIKQHVTTENTSLMMCMLDCFDSHVTNGIIEGDYLERKASGALNGWSSEGMNALSIKGDCRFCSFDNLIVKQITGYACSTACGEDGIYARIPLYDGKAIFTNNTTIDSHGNEIYSDTRSTSNFIDISSMLKYNEISYNVLLGTGGLIGNDWTLFFNFYDENENFIETVQTHQYRKIRIPSNSKFLKLTIIGLDYTPDIMHQLINMKTPTCCEFVDIDFIDNRTCGLNPNQHRDLFLKNINFTRTGYDITPIPIDFEDGWQQSIDVYMNNLSVLEKASSQTGGVIICAGFNHVLYNCNDLIEILVRAGATGTVIKECKGNSSIALYTRNRVFSGYSRIINNNLTNSGCMAENKEECPIIVKNSRFKESGITNSILKNCNIEFASRDEFMLAFTHCKLYNCIVIDNNPNFSIDNGKYRFQDVQSFNTIFTGNTFDVTYDASSFNNCTLNNVSFRGTKNLTFIECNLNDLYIFLPNWYYETCEIEFNNCSINNTNRLIDGRFDERKIIIIGCEVTLLTSNISLLVMDTPSKQCSFEFTNNNFNLFQYVISGDLINSTAISTILDKNNKYISGDLMSSINSSSNNVLIN